MLATPSPILFGTGIQTIKKESFPIIFGKCFPFNNESRKDSNDFENHLESFPLVLERKSESFPLSGELAESRKSGNFE